jgi:hypothetical protein
MLTLDDDVFSPYARRVRSALYERVQGRPALARDNADVLETLQRLQAKGRPGVDPYRVQRRGDRLEWVIKNGFAPWFMDEMKAGRVFFPLQGGA